MARKIVDIGVEGNDGTGDSIREAFRKTNENFKEIYAVFGQEGTLSFLDLGDVEGGTLTSYSTKVDQLPIVNSQGSGIVFKQLQGEGGLTVSYPEDPADPNYNKIVLTQERAVAELGSPSQEGSFGNIVDGKGYMFGNIGDPTVANVLSWNSALGRSGATVIGPEKFPVTLGYADSRYINKGTTPGELADTMVGYLAVPAGATGDQVPQANEVVLKTGGTMTGKLFLNDHPGDLAGAGTPLGADDLQAASKYYVDVTAFSSKVNLYVSTGGDDSQRKTPVGKEGRAWNYAYRTITAACLRAEQLIDESPWETGPYRQYIAYGGGKYLSEIVPGGIAIGGGLNGTTRISFTNDSGSPVDQGVTANKDIIPGKIVIGASSGARGFIVKYATNASVDYVDLRDVTGTFEVGENLVFDQPVKRLEISIYVESGTYFEDYPIKLPQNTSLLGDEFRRTVVRPADRPSKSPWAATWFYRDLTFDGLSIAETNWGYHYLTDPTNKGSEPKNNRELDVFLCNDAVIIRQISCQGHGGFMMVLDPEGQILTKSPYCQQSGSFSASLNKQAFRGGQYVDGQAGSMPVATVSTNVDKTEITITDSFRVPQTPTAFFVQGERYKIDTFTDNGQGYRQARELLLVNKDFIVEETIAYVNDVVTPTFSYDADKCSRDVGYIINAVAWDIVFDSNIQSINTALEYYIRSGYLPFSTQKTATIEALTYVKDQLTILLSANAVAAARASAKMDTIIRIVSNGVEEKPFRNATSWSYSTDPQTGINSVTVTTSTGHGLGAGWAIEVEGASATSNSPNGVFEVVSIANANTFTYHVVNSPSGSPGGTLRYKSTPVSLRSIPNPPADPQALQETIDGINNSLARLVENRELVKAEYIAYINTYYPDFLFGDSGVVGYQRDIDRIINSVTYDAIYGGNSQTIIAAKSFFDVEGKSLVSAEATQIYSALEWAKSVAFRVTTDTAITDLLQFSVDQVRGTAGTEEIANKIQDNFNIVINAIRFGIDTLPGISNPITEYVSTSLQSAKTILEINTSAVRSSTIDYIDSRFLYDQTAVDRDLRQLIDDLAHDIAYTGNLKMIEHGLSYFVGDATFVSDAERTRTLAIIDYFKQLATYVVNNQDVPGIQTINAGSLVVGQTYKINVPGNTVWTSLGAADNNKNTVFTATGTGTITAGGFVAGRAYTIVERGTTNFITIGASSNTVGTTFIATGPGTGTGKASQGTGKVVLASASTFYRRQFAVSQTIQLSSSGTGLATLLPSLVWVNTNLNNAFERLQSDKSTIQAAVIDWINNNIANNVNNPGSIWYGFTYNSSTCSRDVGLIVDAVGYDMMFNSNQRSSKAGEAYLRGTASNLVVVNDQKAATVAAFNYLKNYLQSTISSVTYGTVANTRVGDSMDIVINILQNGESVIPVYSTPDPSGYSIDYFNARRLVKANRDFIIDEITSWIDYQVANNLTPFVTTFTYNVAACERDVAYILDAIEYDLTYGGNLETIVAANAYFVGATSTLGNGEKEETIAAYARLKEVVGKIAQGVTISDKKTTLVQNTSGSGGNSTGSVAFAQDRVQDIIKKINITAIDSTPVLEDLIDTTRTMVANTKGSGYKSASQLLNLNRDFIKAEVVNFINYTYSFTVTESINNQFVTESTTNMRVGMPVQFKGTDAFEVTVTSVSAPLEVDGKFWVTFDFARRVPVADSTKFYEVFGNTNSDYNLILPVASTPTGTTATSITLVYDTNPGSFDFSTTTKIRVSGGIFGGVNQDAKYYVKEIISGTNFTISASISGQTPGALLTLDSDTGTMLCSLAYNQATCFRDVGFLVSNIATDILYGGRYNTIKAGLRYWAGTAALVVGEQSPETRAGISYINTLAQKIITNTAPEFEYNRETCKRDVGLIVDAVLTDAVFGGNYRSITAGLSYLRSYAGVVIQSQKEQTLAALTEAKTLVLALMPNASARAAVTTNMDLISAIIDQGQIPITSTLTYVDPLNTSANITNAAAVLRANKSFLTEEVIAYVNVNLNPGNIVGYNESKCRRDVGYIIDALVYDLMYGGTSQTTRAGNAFISGLTNTIAAETAENAAAYERLKTAIQYVVVNSTGWTKTTGNTATQVTNLPAGTVSESNTLTTLLNIVLGVVSTGVQVADGTEPTYANGVNFATAGTDRTTVLSSINSVKNGVISFLNVTYGASQSYQSLNGVNDNDIVYQVTNIDLENGSDASTDISGLVELVNDIIANGKLWVANNVTDAIDYPIYVLQLNEDTPYDEEKSGPLPEEIIIQGAGNTSMLSNDWTQLNDLAYGLVATNNGLIETVSVFTYYCWTAYYAKNGGQIRSVGGSNAHGEYGCVAEGSDPFEVPDYVNLSDDMVQTARIYKAGPFASEMAKDKTTVYIDAYGHLPYNVGEIEINHGYTIADGVITDIGITRYEIANITDVSSTYFSTTTPAFVSKSSVNGKWQVKFSFTPKNYAPEAGRYYVITGNSNSSYNSTTGWLCVDSDKSSITLEFTATDPGVFGSSNTTIKLKPASILRLNLNTGGNNSTAASGLQKELSNGQFVTIRANQNFKFYNVDEVNPTRPSTALTFRADPVDDSFAPVYRVLAFNTKDPLSNAMIINDPVIKNEVILTFDSGYDYVDIVVDQDHNTLTEAEAGIDGGSTTRTLGSKVGDKYLAVKKIGSARDLSRIATGEMAFAWNGRVHRVVSYLARQISSTEGYGIIQLSENRSGSNGSLISQTYQDLYGSTIPTGITAPTRPGSGYNAIAGAYSSGTGLITYTISGIETAPNAPIFTGSIGGTTLTVTSVASGIITANTQVQGYSGSGLTDGTLIVTQLTGTNTITVSPTGTGTNGTAVITVTSTIDVVAGQIVSGTGVPAGTFVKSVSGSNVTLTKNLTSAASGTYNFRQAGKEGTYTVSISQNVSSRQIGTSYTTYGNSNQSYNITGVVQESTPVSLTFAVAPASAVASISADGTMTVYYVSGNTLQLGQAVSGTALSAGAAIKSQDSGTSGSTGTYTLNAVPSVATPVFTASISTTVLTVSAVTSGKILVGAAIQKTTGSGVTSGTTVTGQITSTITANGATTTATGTSGTAILNVNSNTGILVGQLVEGVSVPADTYVVSINNNAITISRNLTGAAVGGSYTFRTAGGAGTYSVSAAQSVTSSTMAAVFTFIPGTFGSGATRVFPSATLYNPTLVEDNTITLKAGLSKGEPSDIIVNISSCRVTGHDFSEIGTGGYNQTNYPTKIYGAGRRKNQQKEVAERGTGRVFWVSTDQDGFFRVGRFFTVDQGTGTVTFAASLALSNLDGLGFKRGRAISEFSDDDTFQDLADDAVPTENAIDGYLNRRLGIDRNSQVISEGTLGPGFLDRAGILEMQGNIKMNNFNVTGLLQTDALTPADSAVRKDYVDGQQLADTVVDVDGKVTNDILIYNGDRQEPKWVNAKSSSDNSQIQIDLVGDKELNVFVKRETIDDSQVSKDAAITQDKININGTAVQRDQGTLLSSVTKSVGTAISTVNAPEGNSPYIKVKFFIGGTPPKPRTGIYYTISGNSNVNYNGRFFCENSSARVGGDSAWIELTYPENPGVFGGTTTTITPWETTINTQLDHGLVTGDNVTISGSVIAEVSTTATGAINTNLLTVSSGTGIGTGQLVTGTGVPAKTYVKYVDATTVVLTKKLTTTADGTYTFATTINGNWTVLSAPTTTSFIISADTRIAGTYTLTNARATKLGLSSFNRNQFNVTNGFVDLETSTTNTVTASIASGSNIVTVANASAMANVTVGTVITIASGGGTVTMPVVNVQNPLDVTTNGTQPVTVTVTAITSATTFTVSSNFAGTGSAASAVLNLITGVPLSSVQQIETDRIIGNISGSRTAPTTVTTGQIVEAGDGIKNIEFNDNLLGDISVRGIMSIITRDTTYPHKNTYGVWNVTKTGASNSIVRTTADGSIEATQYILDGQKVLDTSSSALDVYTPGQAKFLTASGNSGVQPQPVVSIGSLSAAVSTTATANTNGSISVASTANMYIGQEITFGGTNFGGITNGTTYYIVSVGSGVITMSGSESLTPVFTGVNGTGSMSVVSSGVLNGQVYLPKVRANNTVTLNPVNATVSLQPRSSNGVDGTVIINPAVNGSINNMTIGASIESPGRFTTVEVTSTTDATNSTTAPLKTAGGAAVAKKLFVGSDLSVGGSAVITGNLTVNGVTTTVNSSDLSVDDKNLLLASVGTSLQISCDVNSSGIASNMVDSNGQPPTGLIPGMIVTKISGTSVLGSAGATITIATVNSQSSVTFATTAGSFTAGTLVFTAAGGNDSTANGGGITLKALTDKTINWFSATNRWTSNVGFEALEIENTPIGGDLPASARFTSVQIDDNLTIGATNADTITVNSKFTAGTQLRTQTAAGNTLAMSAYDVDGSVWTDLITLTANNTPKLDLVSTAVGTINNIDIGGTTRGNGKFTTLQANDAVTFDAADKNVSISLSGTGSISLATSGTGVSGGTITIAPVKEGSINNMSIGVTTPKAGAFTTLAANSSVTMTAGTASSSKTTGTLVITGGLGVSGDIWASSINANITGDLTGTADKAKQVRTIDKANTGTIYLTGVDSNNATATDETVYTDGSLSYDTQLNKLTTVNGAFTKIDTTDLTVTNTISGSINGNANTVTNGVYTNVTYDNPSWLNTIAGSKINSSMTADTSGNAGTATKLKTARTISLTNGVTGSASFDGSGDISISCTVPAGAASSVTVADEGGVSFNRYLMFTAQTSGQASIGVDGDFYYKPSSNTLYCSRLEGIANAAEYADLGEKYLADANYEPGTVLVFGGTAEVTSSTTFNDRRVAGVVSTNPAYLMNNALEGEFVVSVALQGRVPCKVIGKVAKGDMLVTSGIKGYAIVNNDPKVGTVIGKALENKTTDGAGVIEVVVGKH